MSIAASLLEKVGLSWWAKHEAIAKAEDIANKPVTDKEWSAGADKGDL